MLAGKRSKRVGDQILREVALILLEKVRDPRLKGVTMTGIQLANDLKHAKIFYSVMGEKEKIEQAHAGLSSAKGFIKREVGIRIKLKYIPEISFIHDASLERGSHLEGLLEKMKKNG